MEAYSSLILLNYKKFNEILNILKLKLASYDNNEVIDALNAISSLLDLNTNYFSISFKNKFLFKIYIQF